MTTLLFWVSFSKKWWAPLNYVFVFVSGNEKINQDLKNQVKTNNKTLKKNCQCCQLIKFLYFLFLSELYFLELFEIHHFIQFLLELATLKAVMRILFLPLLKYT